MDKQDKVRFYSEIGGTRCYSEHYHDPMTEAFNAVDIENAGIEVDMGRIERIVRELEIGERFITYVTLVPGDKPIKITFGRVSLSDRRLAKLGDFDGFF